MSIGPLSFYELARTSHIKRWNTINTAREQNLAEHQYNVTIIGLELHSRAMPNIVPDARFMAALLFHDSAEIRYGDIPTPGKAFIKSFKETDIFADMDSKIMPVLPYVGGRLAPGYTNYYILKLADLIEAAWWIKENGAGHHAKAVTDKCWASVIEFVHKHGMYEFTNPVLADLGLPHINKSERITPP